MFTTYSIRNFYQAGLLGEGYRAPTCAISQHPLFKSFALLMIRLVWDNLISFYPIRQELVLAKDFKPPRAFWCIIAGSFLLAAVALVCYIIAFHHQPFSTDPTDWGAFGGYIGGTLGAVFGFAGFAALLYTIFMQQEELALSRQELEATREELARSAKAQELAEIQFSKQSELIEFQRFDSLYFNIIDQICSEQVKIINKYTYIKEFKSVDWLYEEKKGKFTFSIETKYCCLTDSDAMNENNKLNLNSTNVDIFKRSIPSDVATFFTLFCESILFLSHHYPRNEYNYKKNRLEYFKEREYFTHIVSVMDKRLIYLCAAQVIICSNGNVDSNDLVKLFNVYALLYNADSMYFLSDYYKPEAYGEGPLNVPTQGEG